MYIGAAIYWMHAKVINCSVFSMLAIEYYVHYFHCVHLKHNRTSETIFPPKKLAPYNVEFP